MALQPLRYLCVLCVSVVSLIFESHSTANRYNLEEGFLLLLVPQRDHRINLRSPARRDVTSQERSYAQED